MKNDILFCGDVHGQLRDVVIAAKHLRPMAVVLLGDIESPRPLHIELEPIRDIVWWIAGNHDTDNPQSWSHLVDSELAHRRLDGRVVELPDGTRLSGLGGVFRGRIWYPPGEVEHPDYDAWLSTRQPGWAKREAMFASQRLKHRSSIFHSDYLALASQRADILATHEAGASHPNGFEAIDELASAMGVASTFHGHQHDRLDYSPRWAQLGFKAFGVGLRGITNREGQVITPGELDERRKDRQRLMSEGDA